MLRKGLKLACNNGYRHLMELLDFSNKRNPKLLSFFHNKPIHFKKAVQKAKNFSGQPYFY